VRNRLHESPEPGEGSSSRGLAAGSALVFLLAVGAPWVRFVLNTSLFDGEYLPLGVVWPIAALVIVVNPLVRRIGSMRAFSGRDVAVAFIMGITATAVTTDGLTAFLISNIGAPWYGATPENRWLELFGAELRPWLVPHSIDMQVSWLYSGVSPGGSIPWDIWLIPLFWWLSLFAATFWVCACLVTLLRKQWIDNERLAFPLMEVPLALARGINGEPFWKTVPFMWGAAFSFGIVSFNALGFFLPDWTPIGSSFGRIMLGPDFPAINLRYYFPIIGFAYFVNLDVLASVWVFHLLAVIEIGVMNRLGFSSGRPDIYCSASHAVGWQGFGAMTMLVVSGLWIARKHFREAFHEAMRGSNGGGGGMLSYRTAFFGLFGGLVYIGAFLVHSGMSPTVAAVFIAATYIIFLGITRLVIQSGLVFLRTPMTAQSVTTSLLGTANLSASSMTSIAVSFGWVHTVFFFMPAMAHAAKLASDLKLRRGEVVRAVGLALVIAVPVSIWVTMTQAHAIGGEQLGGWAFGGAKIRHFDTIASKMRNPTGPDTAAMLQFAIGAALMWVLNLVVHRVPGWPVHPIGLTVAFTHPTGMIAFSLFLAWCAKAVLMKIGGLDLYNRARPFFLGLVLGSFTGYMLGVVLDLVFFGPGNGHPLYSL
jgi:hypothetical protein